VSGYHNREERARVIAKTEDLLAMTPDEHLHAAARAMAAPAPFDDTNQLLRVLAHLGFAQAKGGAR
jgi:hypothetical protein